MKKALYSILFTSSIILACILFYFVNKYDISHLNNLYTFFLFVLISIIYSSAIIGFWQSNIAKSKNKTSKKDSITIFDNKSVPIDTYPTTEVLIPSDSTREDINLLTNEEEPYTQPPQTRLEINSDTNKKNEEAFSNDTTTTFSEEETSQTNPPDILNTEDSKVLESNNKKFTARKVDWEKVNQLKSDIGKAGEEIAVQYFKTIYKEVNHASLNWDGLGYDLELTDNENHVFYAEVKTTTKEFGQNIFMSQNEVDFLNNHPETFVLCIVYRLDLSNNDAEIKLLNGKEEINNFFDFEAQSFSISFK